MDDILLDVICFLIKPNTTGIKKFLNKISILITSAGKRIGNNERSEEYGEQ